MECPEYRKLGLPIQTKDRGEIRINTAAYADDFILDSETGYGIREFLDLLAKFRSYTGIIMNVKKCIALAELWDGDRVAKFTEP
jgi:hypothetical protein